MAEPYFADPEHAEWLDNPSPLLWQAVHAIKEVLRLDHTVHAEIVENEEAIRAFRAAVFRMAAAFLEAGGLVFVTHEQTGDPRYSTRQALTFACGGTLKAIIRLEVTREMMEDRRIWYGHTFGNERQEAHRHLQRLLNDFESEWDEELPNKLEVMGISLIAR